MAAEECRYLIRKQGSRGRRKTLGNDEGLAMAQQRIEIGPAEQLEALSTPATPTAAWRNASQRAVTSASPSARDERHEKKARRFAAAYDRSVKIQRALIRNAAPRASG